NGAIAPGDYDNDNRLDLFMTGQLQSTFNPELKLVLHRTNGFSTFPLFGQGATGGTLSSGDFNNDGRRDLLLMGSSLGSRITRLFRNNGNSSFIAVGSGLPALFGKCAVWGDFDNDGWADVLITGADNSANFCQVWKNRGDSTFTNINVALPGLSSTVAAWGDYVNDGNLDFVLAGYDGSSPVTQLWRS